MSGCFVVSREDSNGEFEYISIRTNRVENILQNLLLTNTLDKFFKGYTIYQFLRMWRQRHKNDFYGTVVDPDPGMKNSQSDFPITTQEVNCSVDFALDYLKDLINESDHEHEIYVFQIEETVMPLIRL